MSEWHEAKDEDITVHPDGEVHICVTWNDFGNVYVALTSAQANMIAHDINEINRALLLEALGEEDPEDRH